MTIWNNAKIIGIRQGRSKPGHWEAKNRYHAIVIYRVSLRKDGTIRLQYDKEIGRYRPHREGSESYWRVPYAPWAKGVEEEARKLADNIGGVFWEYARHNQEVIDENILNYIEMCWKRS